MSSNSTLRLYQKLDKAHNKIMTKKNTGQCVKSLKGYIDYKKTYRRIIEKENLDARET